ncbi:MAG TPA: hypothetical protein PLN61_09345 [bacterium]|nr:hypothetical protein [bacterium]HQI48857.1 hypothetical protein [bacterium]HQJ65399.1 hypothetical protein [bacterium]
MRNGLFGLALGLVLLGIQCSEPTKSEEKIPEAPAMIVLRGPASVNAPPQIGQKADEINFYFNSVTGLLADLGKTAPAINSNIYSWEVPLGNGTITKQIKAVRRSDQSVDWAAVLNGVAADGTLYSDRKLFVGKSAGDNSAQSWTFYDLVSGGITHKIAWSKNKNGVILLDDTFAATDGLWHLTNARDFSGSYRYTLAGKLQFEAVWKADGSGSYIDHTLSDTTTAWK